MNRQTVVEFTNLKTFLAETPPVDKETGAPTDYYLLDTHFVDPIGQSVRSMKTRRCTLTAIGPLGRTHRLIQEVSYLVEQAADGANKPVTTVGWRIDNTFHRISSHVGLYLAGKNMRVIKATIAVPSYYAPVNGDFYAARWTPEEGYVIEPIEEGEEVIGIK